MASGQSLTQRFAHPLHALLLSFPIALFSGAVAADLAYLNTAEIQWSNFASWLLFGAEVFGGFVLAWAVIGWLVRLILRKPSGLPLLYLLIIAVMWTVGLSNSLQHSRDGWSSVGMAGLGMSIVSAVLALIAGWLLFSQSLKWERAR